MTIERHNTAERLARIGALLAEAKRTIALMAPTDRIVARQLSAQLDEMLGELLGPQDIRPPSNDRRHPWNNEVRMETRVTLKWE